MKRDNKIYSTTKNSITLNRARNKNKNIKDLKYEITLRDDEKKKWIDKL